MQPAKSYTGAMIPAPGGAVNQWAPLKPARAAPRNQA
jgi:hypothetical protein